MASLIQIRVDDQLKKDADTLFKDLGLDTTTAIRMFLKQAISKSAIPFRVALNDEDAQLAKIGEEAYKEHLKSGKVSYPADEVFKELGI